MERIRRPERRRETQGQIKDRVPVQFSMLWQNAESIPDLNANPCYRIFEDGRCRADRSKWRCFHALPQTPERKSHAFLRTASANTTAAAEPCSGTETHSKQEEKPLKERIVRLFTAASVLMLLAGCIWCMLAQFLPAALLVAGACGCAAAALNFHRRRDDM